MSVLRLGVLVSGRGSNLQAIINEIEAGTLKAEIAVVISNKHGVPALDRAERHGLNAVFLDPKAVADTPDPRQAYDQILLETLQRHQVQLVVLAGYMKIITSILIDSYESRIMNIHPSLLPSFPGLHAQRQALHHGVKVAGCTVHFVTEGMDTGPIILQQTVPVEEGDTEEDLSERILKVEHDLFPRAIRLFAEGRLRVTGRTVQLSDA